MASKEYNWRPRGSKLIAKFVPDEEVQPGSIAPLNQGEFCAYQENRTYVGTYSEMVPEIKAKRGILSRVAGRAPPSRDHLFASQGPHKLELRVQGEWISGETGTINAFLDVTISEHSLGKMFDFASQCAGGEVTPEALEGEIQKHIQAKFNSYVMNLGSRPTNKKELESQDTEFENIADEILGGYGCNCAKAILNYMPSREQAIDEELADVQELADRKAAKRTRSAIERRHEAAEQRSKLKAEMGAGAIEMAKDSERMKRAQDRLSRTIIESKEAIEMAEIEAEEEEAMAQLEIEKRNREARKTKASMKNAKDLIEEVDKVE